MTDGPFIAADWAGPTITAASVWTDKSNSLRSPNIDFDAINKVVLISYPGILFEWLPGGRLQGNEYICADLNGGPGKSTLVNITTGKWSDFATDEQGGDPVSLYAAINKLSQVDAARALSGPHGIDDCVRAPVKNNPPPKPANHQPVPEDVAAPDCVHNQLGEPSMIWRYPDADGNTLQYTARYETGPGEKEFRPWTHNGIRWHVEGLDVPRPLYGLDHLASDLDAGVIIHEGEKATDSGRRIGGGIQISWPGGSDGVDSADWAPMSGRHAFIWRDNDKAGEKAQKAVIDRLLEVGAASIKILDVSDRAPKWDAANAEEEGWTKEDFDQFIASAQTIEIESDAS